MAKNRYINTEFWEDEYIENLNPMDKYLFLYCLTNPLSNIAGSYKISIKRIAFETGIDKASCENMFDAFRLADKIAYIDGYVVIKNFVKHQKVNDNIKKGIDTIMNELPESVKAFLSLSKPLNYSNRDSNSNGDRDSNIESKPANEPATESEVISPKIEVDKFDTDVHRHSSVKAWKDKAKSNKFTPPTIPELESYIKEKAYTFTADEFFDYYESKGWLVGKSKMKKWQSACNNWQRNQSKFGKETVTTGHNSQYTGKGERIFDTPMKKNAVTLRAEKELAEQIARGDNNTPF